MGHGAAKRHENQAEPACPCAAAPLRTAAPLRLTGPDTSGYVRGRLRAVDCFLLTAILAALLVWPLRSPPITTHGEAREGLVVQDIVRNDRWVLPYRNGELPSKPPLFHWLAAVVAETFGLSDATVRLPSALAAWAMALATFALGVTLGGQVAGWLAAGVLLGTHGFWKSASEARVDMLFAACITLAIAGFFRWYSTASRVARAGCYLATACAVLAKGPVGALLPALVIFVFLAREDRLGWWRERADGERRPLPGTGFATALRCLWSWPLAAVVLVVDLGWYGLAYRAGGEQFLAVQLLRENLDRFVGRGIFGQHGGHPLFFLAGHLAIDLLPWSLVLAWAALRWLRGEREDAAGRLLHAWWIVILGFFTLAFGKRGVYLLPLYPAIALLAGRVLAVALAAAPAASHLLGVVPVPGFVRRAFPDRPGVALAAIVVVLFDLVLAGTSQVVREHVMRRKSLASFARAVESQVPSTAALYADPDLDGTDLQVLAYRLNRAIPRAPARADVRLAGAERVYCLVPAVKSDDLARAHYQCLAVSARRGVDVALMLAPLDLDCARLPAAVAANRDHRRRVRMRTARTTDVSQFAR